ncbi:MAG TPA: IS481 family transposase [Spirochaetales bacterium]|nr:IS481 family transposase [Spirochaetales bacterium]
MNIHRNARLTISRREELVGRVAAGETPRAVATALGVSPRTVYKWLARHHQGEGLMDRSSRPRNSPRALSAQTQQRLGELRRQRWTGRRIASCMGLSCSVVFRALRRMGLNRLKKLEPEPPTRRYQWPAPGDMLHIDIKKLGRIEKLGHRMTGDRRDTTRGAGWEFVHVCVDDASRVAFARILPNERQESVVDFLRAAVRYYQEQGVPVRRVMTDNGSGYVSKAFGQACAALGLRHIRTRPYTPRTNGKAERFIQTALREWAYATAFENSKQRASELPRWLHEYNYSRNHMALQGRTPMSRFMDSVNNVCRHHS